MTEKNWMRKIMEEALLMKRSNPMTGKLSSYAAVATMNVVRMACDTDNPMAALKAYELILRALGQGSNGDLLTKKLLEEE